MKAENDSSQCLAYAIQNRLLEVGKLGGQTEKILGLLKGVVGAEFMQHREHSNISAVPSEGGLWLRIREDHVPF